MNNVQSTKYTGADAHGNPIIANTLEQYTESGGTSENLRIEFRSVSRPEDSSNTLYRIFTEDVSVGNIQRALAAHNLDYTLIHGQGCFEGITEFSLIIEIVGHSRAEIDSVALAIGRANHQQSVLVQAIPCELAFIDTSK